MTAAPIRRWYQFSLRTMLIAVTLLAVPLGYVGWQAKIVRERRESYIEAPPRLSSKIRKTRIVFSGDSAQGPNFIRRWLGDFTLDEVELPPGTPYKVIRDTMAMFPESTVNFYILTPYPDSPPSPAATETPDGR